MVLNEPGCMHDSMLSAIGFIYQRLETVCHEFNVRTVADSAFSCKDCDYLIQSAQNLDPNLPEEMYDLCMEATSLRQMAEWGMRGIQGSFPRVKDKIIYEERGERLVMLQLIVRLYNFRANTVGINQIKNVFMPNLEEISDEALKKYYT